MYSSMQQVENWSPAGKIKNYVLNLSQLREKQQQLVKQLKIKALSRRKYVFDDFLSDDVSESVSPSSKRLLYLYSENKRLDEKNFFGNVEIEKNHQLSKFHTEYQFKMNEIVEFLSNCTEENEAERYLRANVEVLNRLLTKQNDDIRKMRESINEKKNLIERFEELRRTNEAAFKIRIAAVKMKLKNGELLNEREMLLLSLYSYQETNMKLCSAVESNAELCDQLSEAYLWKRDEFTNNLAADFPILHRQTDDGGEEDSLTKSPPGSLFDIIVERDDLIRGLAKIAKATERLTKYHYKLRDLKLRVAEVKDTTNLDVHSENSLVVITSTTHANPNPFIDFLLQ